MLCSEREGLLANYQATVTRLRLATESLPVSTRSKVSTEETERLDAAWNGAKRECELARLALDRHLEEHGCKRSTISNAVG